MTTAHGICGGWLNSAQHGVKAGSTGCAIQRRLQPLPADVVGIVGIADSVEVELLQQADVLDHAVLGEGLAAPLIVLMPADALDQDGPAVVQQLAPLDQRLPEPHLHPLIRLQIPEVMQ